MACKNQKEDNFPEYLRMHINNIFSSLYFDWIVFEYINI